jgi:hypothetical protein
MVFIHNADNWWDYAIANEEVVLTLISRFHPMTCQNLDCSGCPVDMAIEAIVDRNSRILRDILGETWFGAAVLEETVAIPGIEVLSTLCNEAWVLDEIVEPEAI